VHQKKAKPPADEDQGFLLMVQLANGAVSYGMGYSTGCAVKAIVYNAGATDTPVLDEARTGRAANGEKRLCRRNPHFLRCNWWASHACCGKQQQKGRVPSKAQPAPRGLVLFL